ncbi:MAG TPA: response regulator [Steroidobacteraceae bacterium]|nr:response regulator [Steroidobacteraceae bacterium]
MESPSSPDGHLAGLTVLVVDDDYFVANECASVLRENGAKVLGPVPDMMHARAALAETAADCVLLDINLKGQMVFELAQELLAQGVPTVFTTGYDSSILPQTLSDTPCLQKPVERRALVSVVRREANGRGGRA